ncbi:MAG: penicillin acylase family protein [Planctomycetota bacterium]|nr:MAG: penicillin acylase family protein [Planctomycetota bacterium]
MRSRFSACLSALLCCAALLPAQTTQIATSGSQLPAAGNVILARDAYGVPHVFSSSDAGAFYGLGWACAEDRFFQMSWNRLMIQGRMAEFFGRGPGDVHLQADREVRYLGWMRHAAEVIQSLDSSKRELLQAYADGVNDYVAQAGSSLHPLFQQLGIPVEPWTAEDCIAAWIRMARHFAPPPWGKSKRLHEFEDLVAQIGLQAAIDAMTPNPVYDDSAAAVKESDVPASVKQAMIDYKNQWNLDQGYQGGYPHESPHFSHAWAAGASLVAENFAALHSDPQTPIRVPALWYEFHLSGRTFEVRGIGVAGSPNVLIGGTPYVSWGATALGMDQQDLFRLTVDPQGHPGEYAYDDGNGSQWLPWTSTTERIHILGENDELLEYRETVWGPMVTALVQDLRPEEEYAFKGVPLHDAGRDSFLGYWDMYHAQSLEAFDAALDGLDYPTLNMVFAEATGSGRVAYRAQGAAPLRSTLSPLGGIIAQDGSHVQFDWLDMIPHLVKPWVMDPADGYVLSGNHMPIGSWYPLIGVTAFGTGSAGDTSRSRRLRERLQAQSSFSAQEVFDIHFDVVQPARRDLVKLLRHLARVQNYPISSSSDAALRHLGPWEQAGARMDNSHYATYLAHRMNLQFRANTAGPVLVAQYGGADNGLQFFLKTKIADIEANPPVDLTVEEADFVDMVVGDAYDALIAQHPDPLTWQSDFENEQLNKEIVKWTSLEGFPSLTPGDRVAVGPLDCVDGGTILAQMTQSWSQKVIVGPIDGAETVAPLGQSEHLGPHHLDQQVLWESLAFKPSPVTRAGVAALPGLSIQMLQYP